MDAAAVALTELVLGPPGGRLYFAAVDRDQAALAFDSLHGFIRRSELLIGSLKLLSKQVIFEEVDSRLEVLAADAPGSWGLRPTFIFADELQQWRTPAAEDFFQALFSGLGKRRGARILIAATAVWDRTSLCWQLREKIQEDPAWYFSRKGKCASWIDLAFLEGQKRILPAHVYKMLHDNEWTEAGGAFLTLEEVQSIFDKKQVPVPECKIGRHFAGLDLGLTHDASVCAIVHKEEDGTHKT